MKAPFLFLLLIFIASNNVSRAQNECNILINEQRILNEDNLDFFIGKMKTEKFVTNFRIEGIPSYIKKKLFCLVGKIANPTDDWNATDVIIDETWPRRQLRFSSINEKKDMFIVVYNVGGIGVSTITMLMSLTDKGILADGQKNVADIWIGQTAFKGDSIKVLVDFILKNRRTKNGLNTNAIYY